MAGRKMLPECSSPAKDCSPTVTRPKVTGWGPQVLEKRKRIVLPHKSGFTIMRSVWLFAPSVVGLGKAKLTSAGVELPWKTSWGAVVQVATHFFPDLPRS